MRPATLSAIGATWLSRSSARSIVSSTRAASARTAVQRSAVEALERRPVVRPERRAAPSGGSRSRSAGLTPSANAASIGATLVSSSRSCWAATAAAPADVKSYCGSTAAHGRVALRAG